MRQPGITFPQLMRCALALTVALGALFVAAPHASSARASAMQTYIVLYKQEKAIDDAASVVANAGGTLVYTYDAIGVAIAKSDSPSFRANLLRDNRIENAATTTGFSTQLNDEFETVDAATLA